MVRLLSKYLCMYYNNLLPTVLTILCYNDLFIKCSANALWKHRNAYLNTSNSDKYTKRSSGLIIHNVTNKDEGQYVCLTLTPTLLTYATVNVICKIFYKTA